MSTEVPPIAACLCKLADIWSSDNLKPASEPSQIHWPYALKQDKAFSSSHNNGCHQPRAGHRPASGQALSGRLTQPSLALSTIEAARTRFWSSSLLPDITCKPT